MAYIIKFIVLFVGVAIGVCFMKYNYPLTRLFGFNSLAERYLGQGGTYTMWRLMGLVVVIGTIWYVLS